MSIFGETSRIGVNVTIDFLLPAVHAPELVKRFGDCSYTVIHEDLGEAIKEEEKGILQLPPGGPQSQLFDITWFDNYHPWEDHNAFLDDLHDQYPDNTEVETIGTSHGGNPIRAVRIFGGEGDPNRHPHPAIVFYGNIHAREWITAPTVEYIAYSLVTNYWSDPDAKYLIDNFDIYILPIVNPDGVIYTETNNRMWRKNRRPPPPGSDCFGVDLNRNFDIHWADPGEGASPDPCDFQLYKGPSAGSEPETQALVSFSRGLIASRGLRLFIDIHSFAQLVLYPWGYSPDVNPDGSYYQDAWKPFTDAVQGERGTTYRVIQTNTLDDHPIPGTSTDFHYGNLGINHSFSIELPGSDFIVPAENILPIVRETWDGLFAFLKTYVYA